MPQSLLDPQVFYYLSLGFASLGGVLTIVSGVSVLGQLANRSPRNACILGVIVASVGLTALIAGMTGAVRGPMVNVLTSYDVWLVSLVGGALIAISLLGNRASEASARIEPIAKVIYRVMLVGVLLLAAGTILGAAWAHIAWGRYWGWDPKEMWVLITLLVYLVPLFGRFVGWLNTFGLVVASVACFMAVLMSWYGVNFVIRAGLHDYGFTEGGNPTIVMACIMVVLSVVGAAAWRRSCSQ